MSVVAAYNPYIDIGLNMDPYSTCITQIESIYPTYIPHITQIEPLYISNRFPRFAVSFPLLRSLLTTSPLRAPKGSRPLHAKGFRV